MMTPAGTMASFSLSKDFIGRYSVRKPPRRLGGVIRPGQRSLVPAEATSLS
jgi:hypothetical protein